MDDENNLNFEKQAQKEAKQREVQSNAESIKNAANIAAKTYGGKLAGMATKLAGKTKTGNSIATAAGNAMYGVNNAIKHPLGIIDPMQNRNDNDIQDSNPQNNEELNSEEPRNNDIESSSERREEKTENGIFPWQKKKDNNKKKINLKRVMIIAGLSFALFFVLLFLIIIIGPGAGAILDLTENTSLKNSNKNDSSNYSINNESDLNNLQYVSINMTDLAVPLYYSDHTTILSSLKFNVNVENQIKNIMKNISSYVKSNPKLIPRFETAGSTVRDDSPTQNDYHSQGYAIDLFNKWSYTSGTTTYSPYNGQGTNTWAEYTKFICNVCNGQENCDKNINYIIFENYFKNNGWCWGGNWGPSYFDPMHFELRKGGCSVANKQTITC